MAHLLKTIYPPRFRLEGIHREGVVAATTGVGDVVGTTTNGSPVPGVHNVEH